MSDADRFDFRWGVPELDAGHTSIPNVILENHAALGISAQEMMLIIHMASFKYASKKSHGAMPSHATLAERMGMSQRHIRRMIIDMEKRGIVTIIRRSGKPSIYDFRALAEYCLNEAKQPEMTPDTDVTPDTHVRGTPDTHVLPPRTPMSYEEEKKEEKTRRKDAPTARSSATLFLPDSPIALVTRAYEQHIGVISPAIADMLIDFSKSYSINDILDAITIAANAGKRNAKYVGGILKRMEGDNQQKQIPKPVSELLYDLSCENGCYKGWLQDADGRNYKCTCRLEREAKQQ